MYKQPQMDLSEMIIRRDALKRQLVQEGSGWDAIKTENFKKKISWFNEEIQKREENIVSKQKSSDSNQPTLFPI